ncbi:DUF3149 domain-containing protein [Arhodomonas sp. SL1]|uniref:DUF3149 domain-containing protein n=1 Tax=Arhodomonas sp. SL1 TaxID=3425691 RepID=UPI003F8835F9
METLSELLAGRPDFWLSLVVILFMLGMGAFFVIFFLRHIREEERSRRKDR